jgi:hypothetical protein
MDTTIVIKCLSVIVTTWTSYALYHTIWFELFYKLPINVDLYVDMLTVEITVVGLTLLWVLWQYTCKGSSYNVGPYLALFSTSAAAIIGITTLLVLLYHPPVVYDAISHEYTSSLTVSVVDIHTKLQGIDASSISHHLFGKDLGLYTGGDVINDLPHGSLLYIFLSSLFTVAYTAPMVLMRCYGGRQKDDAVYSGERGVPCLKRFPVWPAVATVQLVIAFLVLYSWMSPSVALMESVMILAIVCGVVVGLIALHTVYTRTYNAGCPCIQGAAAGFEEAEQYYTDETLHLLVAVGIANVVQATTAIIAYTREVHTSGGSNLYIGCTSVLDSATAPGHEECVVLVSCILALTFRVLLVFYLIAILVLRTVELSGLCRHRDQKDKSHEDVDMAPVPQQCSNCRAELEVELRIERCSWDPLQTDPLQIKMKRAMRPQGG